MGRFRKTALLILIIISAILLSSCGPSRKKASNPQETSQGVEESSEGVLIPWDLFGYESGFNRDEPIYVIGHLAPDSDTVCSAIALADFYEQSGYQAVPAVAGELNTETDFILQKYGVSMPMILNDASGRQFVLVDHSSYMQSIVNMDEADIIGIVDHHNIGNVETGEPIMYLSMPVGSTATVVYQLYVLYNVPVSKEIAGIMLSAILSDTTGLKSATTTEYDIEAVGSLSTIAEVEDYKQYTEEMLQAGNNYDSMTCEEILHSDLKRYEINSTELVIACVQSTDADQLEQIEEEINGYMGNSFDSMGARYVYVMMVNQITAQTKLLCYGDDALEVARKAFDVSDDEIILENTLSRKKQVYPPLVEMLGK